MPKLFSQLNTFSARLWGSVDQSKTLYYSGFLDTVRNASLLNLQEFEKFENDTTLSDIGDLGDLAAKVTAGISLFQ